MGKQPAFISSRRCLGTGFDAGPNPLPWPRFGQVLNFEGLGDQETVLNYYNGGLGGSGSGPGPNFGITFSSNALALIDSDAGGGGNIGNEPSPDTVLFFLGGGSVVMNVPAGFITGFSFFHSSVNFAGTVFVYDGLDATGNQLASLPLVALGIGPGDPNGDFSNWSGARKAGGERPIG